VVYLQVRQFIDGAYQRTLALLREKKDVVEAMAQVSLCEGEQLLEMYA
jgi:ATP-dependent Zn protease